MIAAPATRAAPNAIAMMRRLTRFEFEFTSDTCFPTTTQSSACQPIALPSAAAGETLMFLRVLAGPGFYSSGPVTGFRRAIRLTVHVLRVRRGWLPSGAATLH